MSEGALMPVLPSGSWYRVKPIYLGVQQSQLALLLSYTPYVMCCVLQTDLTICCIFFAELYKTPAIRDAVRARSRGEAICFVMLRWRRYTGALLIRFSDAGFI